MTNRETVRAILLAQGVERPSGTTPEERRAEVLAAWEYLIRTGIVWSLEGWMGRAARDLLQEGIITIADGEE